tara:strand:+ start:912 stop:1127 length:216 start_codon:yes stop_codon:yes gene_type:complete
MDIEDIKTILKILSKYIDVRSFITDCKADELESYTTETESVTDDSDSDFDDLEPEEFQVNILDNGFHELTF